MAYLYERRGGGGCIEMESVSHEGLAFRPANGKPSLGPTQQFVIVLGPHLRLSSA